MPCDNPECIFTCSVFRNRIKLNTENLYLDRELQGISNKHKEIPKILKNALCSIKIPLKNEDYLPRLLREGWYETQKVLRDYSSEFVRLTEKIHDLNIYRSKIETCRIGYSSGGMFLEGLERDFSIFPKISAKVLGVENFVL